MASEAAVTEAETMAVSSVKCYCCGLTEECTTPYIDGVRKRYQGRWICGLCAEAVKESLDSHRDMTTDEALKCHMKFRSSSSSPPNKPTEELILAMKQILFRSLESHSCPTSGNENGKGRLACRPLGRSQSCFSSI